MKKITETNQQKREQTEGPSWAREALIAYEQAVTAMNQFTDIDKAVEYLRQKGLNTGICDFIRHQLGLNIEGIMSEKMKSFRAVPEGQTPIVAGYIGYIIHYYPNHYSSVAPVKSMDEIKERLQARVDFLKMYNEL